MYHPVPPKTYLQIHMYHTFTSKASLFPAAKKNYGVIHIMYLFFGKNQVYARAELPRGTQAAGRIE